MLLNAGKLHERIQIVEPIKIMDPAGYRQTTDRIVRSCWASVHHLRDTELAARGADLSETRLELLIRSGGPKLHRRMAVLYAGERYELTAPPVPSEKYPGHTLLAVRLLTTRAVQI